jgi:DNA sulfur modification protein DndD
MILTKIILDNYGPFYGINEFNLAPISSPDEFKPIVLFGGKNGAGKTSIFEAVKLCLYGPWFNGKMKKKDYINFIKKRIHQPLDSPEQLDSASITLEFKYYQLGEENIFKVRRSWKKEKSKIKENLEIFKNNSLLSDIDSDQWQEFINELIPRGVSNLFFFDGEKIQELANDTENNIFLSDSFKALLGLDIVERLKLDLSIIKRRKLKEDASGETLIQLDELEQEKTRLLNTIDKLTQDKGQLQTRLDYIEKQIEHFEQKLASEGGTFASKRNDLKISREKLEYQIKETEERIRELARGLFPFALTPKYCQKLKERLAKEEEFQNKQTAQKVVKKQIKKIQKELKSEEFWTGLNFDKKTKSLLIEKLTGSLDRTFELSKKIDGKLIHDVSFSDKNKFLAWIGLSLNEIPEHFSKECKKLEDLTREIQEVEAKLRKVPSEEAIKPLIEKLNELNQKKGELSWGITRLKNEIGKHAFYLNEVERKHKKLLEKLDRESSNAFQTELIDKVQDVLDIYEKELKKANIKGLQESFMNCFSMLSRKEDILRHAHIDPKSFTIKLFSRAGNEISKDHQLSAGEKQLYAISMLWALMKASNRDLPLIIDTPLARLDRDHRDNIVKNFFPQASNQTIILSTDTEVDKKYFDELKPFISHSYYLDFDSNSGRTQVKEGYFSEIEGVAN